MLNLTFSLALIITNIFIAHTVADVFLQPRAWAQAKHGSIIALLKHVSLYTLIAWLLCLPTSLIMSPVFTALYWLVNGVFHLTVDAVSAPANWKAWNTSLDFPAGSDERARYQFKAIAWLCIDQILHAWFLVITFILMFSALISTITA